MPQQKRKKQLRKEVLKKVELEFHNKGTHCPYCNYVFSYGFSDVTGLVNDDAERKRLEAQSSSITVCTRCRRTLRMEQGTLHGITHVEEILMTDKERSQVNLLKELLTLANENQN